MNENINLRTLVGYCVILFAALFFFFYASGIMKVLLVFLALIAMLQVPGSAILYFVSDEWNKKTLFLGLGVGFANISFWAYVLGIFHIPFVYSFIVSVGIPYVYLFSKKHVRHAIKTFFNSISMD